MAELTEKTSALLDIFGKHAPVQKDGTFSAEAVKETVLEMADYIIANKEECSALKAWMDSHDFWTSPASTRFHGNVKGGLAAHSLMVAVQALRFAPAFAENFSLSKISDNFSFTAEDVFIAALSHDFCKAGTYAMESKKTKDFNGNWKYEPYYKTKSDLRNLGHGGESVLLLLDSMPSLLKNRTVLEAVKFHMGFSDLAPMETYNYSNILQNPLVLLIQLADQSAAQWWDL
ncbi:HD domain-containing protein [Treponema sp.]|uniref:HD domain-containing protein n=1 Tax=Treponema sp. TaxID=166 RepID=UPI00388FD7C3